MTGTQLLLGVAFALIFASSLFMWRAQMADGMPKGAFEQLRLLGRYFRREVSQKELVNITISLVSLSIAILIIAFVFIVRWSVASR